MNTKPILNEGETFVTDGTLLKGSAMPRIIEEFRSALKGRTIYLPEHISTPGALPSSSRLAVMRSPLSSSIAGHAWLGVHGDPLTIPVMGSTMSLVKIQCGVLWVCIAHSLPYTVVDGVLLEKTSCPNCPPSTFGSTVA